MRSTREPPLGHLTSWALELWSAVLLVCARVLRFFFRAVSKLNEKSRRSKAQAGCVIYQQKRTNMHKDGMLPTVPRASIDEYHASPKAVIRDDGRDRPTVIRQTVIVASANSLVRTVRTRTERSCLSISRIIRIIISISDLALVSASGVSGDCCCNLLLRVH